jgi:hypothetical protein
VTIPKEIQGGIEVLARWAANTGDPVTNGTKIAYMLSVAGRVANEGTPEQKRRAKVATDDFRTMRGSFDPDVLTNRLLKIMGWAE